MARVRGIIVFVFAAAIITGCNSIEKKRPVWEDTKIGDLASPRDKGSAAGQLIKTINFNVFVFEIPVENIHVLDNVWWALTTQPLEFNNYKAFRDNSFMVGYGQVDMWNRISQLLQSAEGKRQVRVSLLLSEGQSNDFAVADLEDEKKVYYSTAEGFTEKAIGPGILAIRAQAERVPGSRGVCKFQATPVFSPPASSSIPQIAEHDQLREFVFTAAGFKLKMSPGDFFFLGPEKYTAHQTTLDSLFFSRPRRKPVVRIYLFVCTGIVD
jgi:hypothetical protein